MRIWSTYINRHYIATQAPLDFGSIFGSVPIQQLQVAADFSGALSGLLSVIPLPRPQHLCLSASIRAKQELICLVIDSHFLSFGDNTPYQWYQWGCSESSKIQGLHFTLYSYASPRWSASHLVVGESHQLTSADQQTHCTHDLIASVSNYQNHSYITRPHRRCKRACLSGGTNTVSFSWGGGVPFFAGKMHGTFIKHRNLQHFEAPDSLR